MQGCRNIYTKTPSPLPTAVQSTPHSIITTTSLSPRRTRLPNTTSPNPNPHHQTLIPNPLHPLHPLPSPSHHPHHLLLLALLLCFLKNPPLPPNPSLEIPNITVSEQFPRLSIHEISLAHPLEFGRGTNVLFGCARVPGDAFHEQFVDEGAGCAERFGVGGEEAEEGGEGGGDGVGYYVEGGGWVWRGLGWRGWNWGLEGGLWVET